LIERVATFDVHARADLGAVSVEEARDRLRVWGRAWSYVHFKVHVSVGFLVFAEQEQKQDNDNSEHDTNSE
jgi:hypothetical protein